MGMWSPRRPNDTSVVDWLDARTEHRPYADNPWVQDLVGPGWPAYARIFCEPDLAPSWAEMARRNGKTMHPLAEWERISTSHGPNQPNRDRSEGYLPDESWVALCHILSRATTTPESVFCLLWDVRVREHHPELAHLPFVVYHGMTCWLAEAALDEIAQLSGWDQPDYLWPADKAWTVMSHYDFEFAVLGGTPSLVAAVTTSPDMEALEVPADSRWGDKLN